MKKRIGMYPGSFDPVTKGHMNIIERAVRLFDEVVVAVMYNPEKQGTFPFEKRVEMLKKACAGMKNVRIVSSCGLTAELARQENVCALIRGVRNQLDLESENDMAHLNSLLAPGLDTIYFPAELEKSNISSTYVRQLASFHADIAPFVPAEVLDDVTSAFSEK